MKTVPTRYRFLLIKDRKTKEITGCLWRGKKEDVDELGKLIDKVPVTFERAPRGQELATAFEAAVAFGGDAAFEVFEEVFTLGLQAGMALREKKKK